MSNPRTFHNSKKKNEMGYYTQNPKTVVPGWVFPLFSLDSGIAVRSSIGIQMWSSWTLGLQSIAQTYRPTRNNFRLFTPTNFVINRNRVHNSE